MMNIPCPTFCHIVPLNKIVVILFALDIVRGMNRFNLTQGAGLTIGYCLTCCKLNLVTRSQLGIMGDQAHVVCTRVHAPVFA